jgi:hypothetical protein
MISSKIRSGSFRDNALRLLNFPTELRKATASPQQL